MRSLTRVPEGKDAEQVGRQSIPAGSLVTLAEEPCSILTFSVCGPGCGELWPNAAAISVVGLSIRSVHGPTPAAAQGPSPHAAKRPSALGTGVSVVVEPYRTATPHTLPAPPQFEAGAAGDSARAADREQQRDLSTDEPCPHRYGTVECDVADRRDPDASALPADEEVVRIRFAVSLRTAPRRYERLAACGHWTRPSDVITLPPLVTAISRTGPCSGCAEAPPTASSARATAPHKCPFHGNGRSL